MGNCGALSLGEFFADAGCLLDGLPVLQRDGVGEIGGRENAENAERDFRADALDRLQCAEPCAFDLTREPKEADRVFAHMCVDGECCFVAGL
jgi:hypothetical protein